MQREMILAIIFLIIAIILSVIGFFMGGAVWFIRSAISVLAVIYLIWRGKRKK